MARTKTQPESGAYVAVTPFCFGEGQRQVAAGDIQMADDEAVRCYPQWFARAGHEDGPTMDGLIAEQLTEQAWQPPPPPRRETPRYTGSVRATGVVVALLPPDGNHDGPRSIRIEQGEVLDAEHPAVVLGPEHFEEVSS